MNNILEICQEVADLTATQRPDDLFDKNTQHNAIFLSVMKNELESLMRYGDWQSLIKQATFQTLENKRFYSFDEIVPDFYALIHNTIYIKDSKEKVLGALTSEEFMKQKCVETSSGKLQFKIENNGFRFLSKVPEGLRIVFLYRSNGVCYDAKSCEVKSAVNKNTDVPLFDKYVVKLGVTWRWLKRNGMDYSEEYNEYERELKKKFGLEQNVKDIRLAQNCELFNDGLVIEHKKGC